MSSRAVPIRRTTRGDSAGRLTAAAVLALAITLVSSACSHRSADGPGAMVLGSLQAMQQGNVQRVLSYYPPATDAFTASMERMAATRAVQLSAGSKSRFNVVSERIDGDRAMVVLRETTVDGKTNVDSFPAVLINGRWKIPLQ